ncbi:addiction module toxin, RelE/StbE family [Bartonella australis AUST/NH1]|uniref:Addiction module toxin, RelE/StbE family n=1 Tax=Bartonella australis (strain Aust/NH1) TaxID=1094489 RepID=M1NS13_BARAA|nr:type II toxin-antitoxin system YafQ family toxin [Bartonella australis]AGF74128.1 addiction module toxin, RelE/StbE family [Bartonella australis AUST/NH1]
MRKIQESTVFKRDIRREAKGRYGKTLAVLLRPVLVALANDEPLEVHYRDHALTGNWHGCRDCHIKPDLVLIYRKTDGNVLELLRLGSHSELRL